MSKSNTTLSERHRLVLENVHDPRWYGEGGAWYVRCEGCNRRSDLYREQVTAAWHLERMMHEPHVPLAEMGSPS